MKYKTKKIIFATILVLGLVSLVYIHKNLEIKNYELKSITGTLDGKPNFKTGARGRGYLEFKLKEFYNRHFQTNSFSYGVLKKDLVKSNLKNGSNINIKVKKDRSNSWSEDFNRKKMNIYSVVCLNDDLYEYISLKEYNEYRKKDFWFTYLVWIIFAGVYGYWIFKNERTRTQV